METTEKIKRLSYEQLDSIVNARRAVPLVGFLSVNGKARSACVMRHPGWLEELNKYTNAAIEASVRSKVGNAVSVAAILSAFESMCIGLIAKKDLTLDEYDLIMSPTISAFPELIVLEQDWTPEPMEETSRFRPFKPYNLPPIETRTDSTTYKKTRPFRRTEDLEEKVADAAFDAQDIMAALKPKPKQEPVKLTAEEALAKMLEAMKPKTDLVKEVEVAVIESEIKQLQSVTPEDLGITSKKLTTEEMLRIMRGENG